MILAHVFLSGAFVWIYSRGVEPKPWAAQGARFGLAVAMPGATVVKQIVFDTILVVVLGVIAAFMYRKP